MPVNDGSNISIAGPRGGLTTTDPFQQASKLFSAMRRASGGSDGTNAAVAAALGLPPNAKIDYMLDPKTGAYVPVVGGTDELRKHNLEAAKQRRAIEVFNSDKAAGIREKLKGFGGMSAEKQASVLNDIRMNDIPKLSQDAQISGSDLITYGLADYNRMQKENAANVAKTGVGDILWDSLRVGARNFVDSVADIFSDSKEQLARADLRKQYIRDIQDNNAFLRNRALQQQEGAGFMDRFGWGELAATTGEFLAENAPVLAATALTGGAAGLAARGLGAAAATAGRASMLGSAVGGGLTGAPTQLGSAINEIAADNKLTEDQKLQALDEAYGPSVGAGMALGAVVMPFGQYISRGIGSGLARAGVGNSNVAKMVRSRRAGEALPTGTNNWDEAMAMARRNDILAENEAIANQRFYRGMLGRRLRDSAIEGSLLSGASQMATNAAVNNDLMENVGPATIGGAIGGALFTPFNRRTAMGVPDDVIGQRTTERQKLAQLLTNYNAERAGDTVSREDQILNAMDAWNTAAGFRGDALFDNARPMTPEQREAYLRQQSYDDLLLNRMMAHEQTLQARQAAAQAAAQARQDEARQLADFWRNHSDTLSQVEFTPRSIFDVMPDVIPNTTRTPKPTPSLVQTGPIDPFDAEWNRIARDRLIAQDAARIRNLINAANIPSRMEYADYAGRDIFDTTPANLDRIAAEDAARAEAQRNLLTQQAINLRNAWSLDPIRRVIETPRSYARSTPDLDAEWAANEDILRQIQGLVPTAERTNLVNTLAGIRNLQNDAILRQEGIDYRVPGLVQAWDAAPRSLMDPANRSYARSTPDLDAEWAAEVAARSQQAIDRLYESTIARSHDRLAIPEETPRRADGAPISAGPYVVPTPQGIALPAGTGRATAGESWVGPSLVNAMTSAQEETPYTYTRVMNNAERAALRRGREGLARTLGAVQDVRQAQEAADDRALSRFVAEDDQRKLFEANRDARTRLVNTLAGGRNVRTDATMSALRDIWNTIPEEAATRNYTRNAPELDAEWQARGAEQEAQRTADRTARYQRYDARQKLVDTLAARREARNNMELQDVRTLGVLDAWDSYGNRVNDENFRHDFTVYEGEVLLENNPGVLPTNNYLPENVAAVVEHLGEPRTAETMLDGTPATDQRPKPQRPYTKAITYASSDDALRKFTGKLRGRESMIPRDVREEQMGWMNDILAAGTGKGRISAQGVLAKDVRSTLDRIVDAQTVDSAMRLDELLLTRLRGSEGTSLFNRAQRAAMQYVRNRIYTTMDDYAYQNNLGRYGEINANNSEDTDPTGGGGSPTSGMGRADTAGAEPLADANLSDDSGRPTDTAGASEATAGQLPVSPAADSAAVEERGDAGAKASGAGENQKVEGDSAAETAQQQTADGKRGAGDAARVDAAANQSAGGDRLEGSSEQGNDRDAADTGSNKQPGSRTEPEDGEPVEVEHTDDWPWDDIEEERSAREEIRVNKETGEIGFRPNRLHDGYDDWNTYGVRDLFVPKREKADPDDGSSPSAEVTFKNANGDTYMLSFDFYKKQGNVPAHWSMHEEIPGVRIDQKGYVWINLKQAPEELQRAASGFEARAEILLRDDEYSEVANSAFPILPEEYPITGTPETRPATQNEAAPTAEQTPTVEPKGLSSAEEIAARQANPDRVPTEGVDPESNEALAWAAQQEGNRTHVEDDEFPAIDADFLLNDLRSSKRTIFWHEFALQGEEIERSLAEKRKQLFAKMLEIMGEPDTPTNEAAAQKVVEENGPVDIRETFVEDAAPANATITAKDSLRANTKKKIQKAAAQNLPQLPIDTPAPATDSPAVFSERFGRTIDDMEKQYARNNSPIDGFIRGAASSGASAKRIIAKRNAADATWKEDLRNDMAETAARIGIMRSTGLFGEIKRGSPLAKKEEFYKNNNIPLIAPNSDMARHLREYFGAMPARERKITQAIDYVLRDPTAQKFDIINDSTQGAC